MNEQSWISSSNPAEMLSFYRGEISDRKLRLFAVACCRAIDDGVECQGCNGTGRCKRYLGHGDYDEPDCDDCHGTGRVGGLTDPRSRRAVEVAERFADGEATAEERTSAIRDAYHACREAGDRGSIPHRFAALAHDTIAVPPPGQHVRNVVSAAVQAALLRDIIGDPWRPVKLPMLWTAPMGTAHYSHPWLTATVLDLARHIYAERAFDLMPILADALKEGGATNAQLLDHCRGPGPHCRGCWVVDLILGKE